MTAPQPSNQNAISQQFFNQQVLEYKDLLEVSLEEAIEETISSFKVQNANMINVIPEYAKYPDNEDPISLAVGDLENDCDKAMQLLKDEMSKGITYKVRVGTLLNLDKLLAEGATNSLALDVACLLVDGQPELATKEILEKILASLSQMTDKNDQLLNLLYLSCCKHEANRELLSQMGAIKTIAKLAMESVRSEKETNVNLLKAACKFLRVMTFDDDIRVEFGNGNLHAVTLASETPIIQTFAATLNNWLLQSSAGLESDANSVGFESISEILETISTVLVREEFCLSFLKKNGVATVLSVMEQHVKKKAFVLSCLRLLTNVCRSDDCKLALVSWRVQNQSDASLVPPACELIVAVGNQYIGDPQITRFTALLISHSCLRQTSTAKNFVVADVASYLAKALQVHLSYGPVVRAVCMAIRTCVGRSPELRTRFVPASVIIDQANKPDPSAIKTSNNNEQEDVAGLQIEANLNKAVTMTDCEDEAKAALRDLGCKVHLKELWTGTAGLGFNQN